MAHESEGWQKVRSPKAWRAEVGEVLEGTYLGTRDAEGQHGPYRKYIISKHNSDETYFLTGTVADGLFMTGVVQPGVAVRVVFRGMVETATYAYKDYDMYVRAPV